MVRCAKVIILLLDLSPPLVLAVAVLIYKRFSVRIKVWGRDSFLSFYFVCSLINSAICDKTVSDIMFSRAQARKSGLAEVEQPVGGPFGAAPLVRPTQEAVEKPESSPAKPAGPVPVPATPEVITTSEDGLGKNRPEGFSLAGISLRCPGGQADHTSSIEGTQRPPKEHGTCPLPGLATGKVGYQTASSGSDEVATGLLDNTPEKRSGDHTRQSRIYAPNSRRQQRNNTPHKTKSAAAARVAAWGADGCR